MADPRSGVAERWPAGYRCALSVTIDVDGRYGETNFRPDDMYWISQTAYDPRGTERLLALLADRESLATHRLAHWCLAQAGDTRGSV